jgi:hypothetical protein
MGFKANKTKIDLTSTNNTLSKTFFFFEIKDETLVHIFHCVYEGLNL